MYSGAADTDEDPKVPAGPSRIYVKGQLIGKGCIGRWWWLRLFFLQSAQLLLLSNLTSVFSACWFCAALSAAGFGARRDMLE